MIKVGLIGCGRWGQNHARIFSELKECRFVGIADTDPSAKKIAQNYGVGFFQDYRDMLPLVDAVSIVVPTNLHYSVAKECLLRGKHVMVEKPLTLSSRETKELIDVAKQKKLILSAGYLFRFNAAALELKNVLKEIGDINYVTARYIHSNKPPRKDCGVIFNFATHLIDILAFLLDKKPIKVFCKKSNILSKEREDAAFILLDYGDFIANLEVSWLHPLKRRDMWIIGSKGKIYADFFEQIIRLYPIEITPDEVRVGKETNIEVRKNEPLKDELRSFCASIKNNGHYPYDEYLITKVCELCLESAEAGKEMELK